MRTGRFSCTGWPKMCLVSTTQTPGLQRHTATSRFILYKIHLFSVMVSQAFCLFVLFVYFSYTQVAGICWLSHLPEPCFVLFFLFLFFSFQGFLFALVIYILQTLIFFQMPAKIFFHSVGCIFIQLFPLLCRIFFILFNPIFNSQYYVLCYWIPFQKLSSYSFILECFQYVTLTVSDFKLRSLINFESVFIQSKRQVSSFILLGLASFPSAVC